MPGGDGVQGWEGVCRVATENGGWAWEGVLVEECNGGAGEKGNGEAKAGEEKEEAWRSLGTEDEAGGGQVSSSSRKRRMPRVQLEPVPSLLPPPHISASSANATIHHYLHCQYMLVPLHTTAVVSFSSRLTPLHTSATSTNATTRLSLHH